MYGVSPQAYDRAITVFSPDGRLFQVEYAKEAVKRGATAVGVTGSDSIVLAAYKSATSNLIVSESLRKIFMIDDHIAVTASGLIADARRLVDVARMEAQKHKLTYNESISVETLTRSICDLMQIYTQYGGIRPFGVSLLIAGIDETPKLFEAEPSGAMTGFKADSIGNGKKAVDEYFEKNYKDEMSFDEAASLALKGLRKTTEKKLTPENVELMYATKEKKEFRKLESRILAKFLK
ncbi:archaeal proteasome endopeptidase complex subunit alpha [Candidatus Micrarchaeota archaeon]|nr:archaeal proteasome endopeptidase complex subunit alpha [Candidatus Micrarchaeota archaeon]